VGFVRHPSPRAQLRSSWKWTLGGAALLIAAALLPPAMASSRSATFAPSCLSAANTLGDPQRTQTLPFVLQWTGDSGGLLDRNGRGIGFTEVQPNTLGNEYTPQLLELDGTHGLLHITTPGAWRGGSNWGLDNTLHNGLQTTFDGSSEPIMVSARLHGPFNEIDRPGEYGGIMWGADQDNLIRLTLAGDPAGLSIRISYEHALNGPSLVAGRSAPSVEQPVDARVLLPVQPRSDVDLALVSDPATGTVSGWWAVDGGDPQPVPVTIALEPQDHALIFSSTARAGLLAVDTEDVTPITLAFDRFAIEPQPANGVVSFTPSPQPIRGAATSAQPAAPTVSSLQRQPPPTQSGNLASGSRAQSAGPVAFDQIRLPSSQGHSYTSVAIGPDNKLYAGTLDGLVVRFPIGPDGTLGASETITTVVEAAGETRLITGIVFDPEATADNPLLWVSHGDRALKGAREWSSTISRLSGARLQYIQDYVIHLPRSYRDHTTNGLAWGPDGALYVMQGSNTAMGDRDRSWGSRTEQLLTAAVLRLDPQAIAAPPLDAQTANGGSYDPFAPGAPLTIYATGIRNAYDLLWHSNGHLYVPTNGSAAGGNTPPTPPRRILSYARQHIGLTAFNSGPPAPGLIDVSEQSDVIYRVDRGGYYGHPNGTRCEWIMNGGNPTAGYDPGEVAEYPIGTHPDLRWRGAAAFNVGVHYSPNGVIEYRSDAFGDALAGQVLVARFGGSDIAALQPDPATGDLVAINTTIAGLSGLAAPLDLVENPATGDIYVAEFAANRLTLLQPQRARPATSSAAAQR
jgi:hypothetical protein